MNLEQLCTVNQYMVLTAAADRENARGVEVCACSEERTHGKRKKSRDREIEPELAEGVDKAIGVCGAN
jgi:hypothetical protein